MSYPGYTTPISPPAATGLEEAGHRRRAGPRYAWHRRTTASHVLRLTSHLFSVGGAAMPRFSPWSAVMFVGPRSADTMHCGGRAAPGDLIRLPLLLSARIQRTDDTLIGPERGARGRRERGSPDPLNVPPELPFGCADREIRTYSQRLWKAAFLSCCRARQHNKRFTRRR